MPSRPKPVALDGAIGVSIYEAQKMMRLGHSTVSQLVKQGALKSTKIGSARRIDVASIHDVMAHGYALPPPTPKPAAVGPRRKRGK